MYSLRSKSPIPWSTSPFSDSELRCSITLVMMGRTVSWHLINNEESGCIGASRDRSTAFTLLRRLPTDGQRGQSCGGVAFSAYPLTPEAAKSGWWKLREDRRKRWWRRSRDELKYALLKLESHRSYRRVDERIRVQVGVNLTSLICVCLPSYVFILRTIIS